MDVPLGYTLSIWATGQEVIRRYGEPTVRDLFLFVGGALVGYVLVTYTVAMVPMRQVSMTQKSVLAITDLITVLAAVATTTIAEVITSGTIGYFVAPFLVTVVFVVVLGTLDHFTLRIGPRR